MVLSWMSTNIGPLLASLSYNALNTAYIVCLIAMWLGLGIVQVPLRRVAASLATV